MRAEWMAVSRVEYMVGELVVSWAERMAAMRAEWMAASRVE